MKFVRIIALAALVALPGCGSIFRAVTKTVTSPVKNIRNSFTPHKPNYWERYGKVYYLDGAGNLGYGEDTVPKALHAVGFRGDIEIVTWTSYTGPLGDQLIRANARNRAETLTKRIVDYRRRYPDTPIYIIGLSAGTGVAVWAVESLPREMKVDTLVLLSSSLSTNYDMTRCLRHVKNKVYVLSSSRDAVLKAFIPVTGTIDGSHFVEPAGLVGLYPASRAKAEQIDLYREKIVNIPWRPSFERLGNAGGHTDGTSLAFVKYYIAPKLLGLGPRAHIENPPPDEPPAADHAPSN